MSNVDMRKHILLQINSLSFIYSYRIKKEGMNYKMKNQKRKVTKLKPKEGNQNERKSVLIKI